MIRTGRRTFSTRRSDRGRKNQNVQNPFKPCFWHSGSSFALAGRARAYVVVEGRFHYIPQDILVYCLLSLGEGFACVLKLVFEHLGVRYCPCASLPFFLVHSLLIFLPFILEIRSTLVFQASLGVVLDVSTISKRPGTLSFAGSVVTQVTGR